MPRNRPGLREPGEVTLGDWAHVKYNKRQHLVVAVEPEIDAAEPVRFACGHRTWLRAVWHDPALPHLARCKKCEASENKK